MKSKHPALAQAPPRLLKHAGLTRRYQPHHDLIQPAQTSLTDPHQEWQMDAQGVMRVEGVGKVSLISIVDVTSRLKTESYPSRDTTNPALPDYQLTLRRAFLTYGLPQTFTLDHGAVFYDNKTPSPFPTRLHLWLIALGVQVRFTRERCPTDHAMIERTHQTLTAQALLGQAYPSHSALWAGLDARRDVLNRHVPSRVLSHQSPLQAYPQAVHSGRFYRPEWEEEFLSLEKLYTYLAQCRWVRSIRPNGCFELGSYHYYVGNRFARHSVIIGFDPGSAVLLCQPEGSEETMQLPVQVLTKAELMGELAALQALPIYQ